LTEQPEAEVEDQALILDDKLVEGRKVTLSSLCQAVVGRTGRPIEEDGLASQTLDEGAAT
jgi:hypothetical protein